MFPPDQNQQPQQPFEQGLEQGQGLEAPMQPGAEMQPEMPQMEQTQPAPPPVDISESEEAKLLSTLMDDYLDSETGPRDINMREWRKHINYWDGLQYTAWDQASGSWKTPQDMLDEDPQSDIDPSLYAKVVNV